MKVYISKADTTLSVDWEAMPEAAKRYIIAYGLRQKLNDAGSQFKKGEENTEANALGAAETVLEALMRGEVTVRQAAKQLTIEERVTQGVIRSLFKAVCKKPVAKERDQSNEALLAAIVDKSGKSEAALMEAMAPRIAALVEVEKAKPALPEIDLENL